MPLLCCSPCARSRKCCAASMQSTMTAIQLSTTATLQTWHTSLQALLEMRPHLESLKAEIKVLRGEATANKFLEEDLQLLWDKRCRDQEDLKVVSRDGLRHMGLEEILIDHLKPETEGEPGCLPVHGRYLQLIAGRCCKWLT